VKKLICFVLFSVAVCSCNNHAPESGNPPKQSTLKDSPALKKDTTKAIAAKSDTTPLPPEHYTRQGPEIGFDLCDSERVGDLHIGMTKEQVIKLLGQPESKSDTMRAGADGLLYQQWEYKKQGISLAMGGDDLSNLAIRDLTVFAPCTFKTRRRIGIGSTVKDISTAYKKAMRISSEKISGMIILGSAYGGIQFTINKDKVDTLFIGASAE